MPSNARPESALQWKFLYLPWLQFRFLKFLLASETAPMLYGSFTTADWSKRLGAWPWVPFQANTLNE